MRLVLPLLAGALILAALPAAAPAADKEALRQSIGKSMSLLNKAQAKFEHQATCASCHNQVEPMVAAVAMRSKGLAVDEAVYNRQLASTAEVIKLRRDYMLGHGVAGGAHVVVGALLQGLSETRYPADEDTDTAVMFLIAKQAPSGAWQTVNVRAPHTVTSFYTTANSVRAIDAYAPPALRKDADAAIAKARAWLIATPATDNDGLSYRLEGLVWSKAPRTEIAKASRQLAASQRPDGGWGQYPNMASDAYATGQSLIALYKAGMKPTDPAYQRGLDYLLKTQAADGSWYVKAHALPIQPPIDSGFPYGSDQWISSWATAYAVQVMAYAL
jgi:squalene cyclase